MEFRGSFGFQSIDTEISPATSTMSGQVDLSIETSSLTFTRITVQLDERLDLSGDFDVGGQNVTITGQIIFDSTLDFLDNDPISLTTHPQNPQPGEFFTSTDFATALGSSEQTRLVGRYSFSGPNQTISNNFSINPEWQRHDSVQMNLGNYPTEIIFSGGPGAWYVSSDDINIVDMTIDGVDISVDLSSTWFRTPNNMSFIPEPETYALAMALLLLGFVPFRQCRNAPIAQMDRATVS